VRVHYNIRNNSVRCCGHILLPQHHSNRPLLSVSARMFISNRRLPMGSHPDFQKAVAVSVPGDGNLIHATVLIVADCGAVILVIECSLVIPHRTHLANNHIVFSHKRILWNVSRFPQQTVIRSPHPNRRIVRRNTEFLFISGELTLFLVVTIRAIERGCKETAIDCALIKDHAILLIISSITGNRYDRIQSGRKIIRRQRMNQATIHDALLRVTQNVCETVHTLLEACQINAHCLLTHRRLIRISRRLIMITEWNNRSQHSHL